MLTNILALERLFDDQLPETRLAGGPGADLLAAGKKWSEATWVAAESRGPLVPGADAVERGLELGRRPVFVCGVHRSGTTLVRDLLDAHPALTVLPSEGTFFTSLQAQLERLPRGRALPFFGREWLRRLANPINQPPYWLLGQSAENGSPYVVFARVLMGWWPVVEQRLGREVSSWPLLAVALAYASSGSAGGHTESSAAGRRIPPEVTRWVEKTPTNERFLDRLWRECPTAKVVHVVRDPEAVFASRKRMEEQATGSFRNAPQVLRDLALSYRVAADRPAGDAARRYLLLKYEALIDRPAEVVGQLATFLEIEPLPILLRPTVAGVPSPSNTSFGMGTERGRILSDAKQTRPDVLTRSDRVRVAAAVGDHAAALGYRTATIGRWRARLLRMTSGL